MAPRKKKSAAGPTPGEPQAESPHLPAGEDNGRLTSEETHQVPQEERTEGQSAKRVRTRRVKKRSRSSSDAVYEKMVGAMLSAYVLDAIGQLSPKRRKLIEVMSQQDPDWPSVIESAYGINRTLIRSIYALWTEHFSPGEAVLFLLRGLNCPGGRSLEALVEDEFGA